MTARFTCAAVGTPLAARSFFDFRTTVSFSATAARALLPGAGWTSMRDEEGDSAVTRGTESV